MNERPTPETNAMRGEWAEGRFWPDQGGPLVQVEDAERLERERDEAREELEDWRNAAKGAENPCPDEKHCTCVPLLHKMLKDARETVAIVTDQLVQVQMENRRLRKALTACMDIIGPPESLSDECWKTTEDINDVWNAGKEALEA